MVIGGCQGVLAIIFHFAEFGMRKKGGGEELEVGGGFGLRFCGNFGVFGFFHGIIIGQNVSKIKKGWYNRGGTFGV